MTWLKKKWKCASGEIKIYYIAGIVFSIIFGTLMHFTYEWSNKNALVGMFTPVNESIWEHFKLVFTPMFFYTFYGYLKVGNNYSNFLYAMAMGILSGMSTMLVLFSTYKGILGRHYLTLDIIIFLFSILTGFGISFKLINLDKKDSEFEYQYESVGACVLLVLLFVFILFTFNPPKFGMFLQ